MFIEGTALSSSQCTIQNTDILMRVKIPDTEAGISTRNDNHAFAMHFWQYCQTNLKLR